MAGRQGQYERMAPPPTVALDEDAISDDEQAAASHPEAAAGGAAAVEDHCNSDSDAAAAMSAASGDEEERETCPVLNLPDLKLNPDGSVAAAEPADGTRKRLVCHLLVTVFEARNLQRKDLLGLRWGVATAQIRLAC